VESPRKAVEDTLRHLAERLEDLGFELRSGLKLARRRGDLVDELRAATDRGNRAGESVRVRFSAMIHSQAAERWAREQENPVLHAEGPFAGIVAARQLEFAEGIVGSDFDILSADDRPFVAEIVAAKVQSEVVPWFERMGDPAGALAALGCEPANETWILRLALAHGLDLEARDALARRCAQAPEFGRIFAQYVLRIAAEGPPAGYHDTAEELAAFAVAAGIAI